MPVNVFARKWHGTHSFAVSFSPAAFLFPRKVFRNRRAYFPEGYLAIKGRNLMASEASHLPCHIPGVSQRDPGRLEAEKIPPVKGDYFHAWGTLVSLQENCTWCSFVCATQQQLIKLLLRIN